MEERNRIPSDQSASGQHHLGIDSRQNSSAPEGMGREPAAGYFVFRPFDSIYVSGCTSGFI